MKNGSVAVTMIFGLMTVLCSTSKGVSAQTSAASAPVPLTLGERFRLYLRQSYSTPSMLVPVGLAAIDQATDSPKEWGEGGQGYLNRLGTRRGQLQIGNFCAFSVDDVLHDAAWSRRTHPMARFGPLRRNTLSGTQETYPNFELKSFRPAFGTQYSKFR